MQPLPLPHPALSLSSHPTEPLLAIGTTENLLLAKQAEDQPAKLLHTHTLPSIHATTHFNDQILAASSTKIHTFTADTPGKVFTLPTNDSPEDLSLTTLTPYNAHTVLAGDSDGAIHLLDTRTSNFVTTLEQGDYITSIQSVSHLGTDAVLASSGDGTLCAYDIRVTPKPRVKLMYATDTFHDDLLSLAILDSHAVAGTLSGALNVYDLRFMDAERGDDVRVDRFFGHPECVNAVLRWEDCVVTASSDGYVRVVDVLARRLLGILEYDMEGYGAGSKRKGDEETWPVEDMVCVAGWGRPVFALRGHDEVLRFCDGRALVDDYDGDDDGDKEGASKDEGKALRMNGEEEMSRKQKKKKRRNGPEHNTSFFDDL